MFQGNWKCSTCGGAITELPFEPRGQSGLTCRTCYAKGMDAKKGAAPAEPEELGGDMATASEPAPTDDIPDFDEAQLAGEAPDMPEFEGATSAVAGASAGDKPRFAGDWKCATCGGAITSLPFQPRDTSNLKCMDCFKASKA